MEKHACKLCSRSFANGRALGGHMRSHVTAKPSSSSSEADVDSKQVVGPHLAAAYCLRENPKKSILLLLSDPNLFGSSTVDEFLVDTEGGSESQPAEEPGEQDVAISLMMLSRDTWTMPMAPKHDGAELSGEREATVRIRPAKAGRSKYQCGNCKRVFRSYQALGGHRASRKKTTDGCRPVKAGGPTRIGSAREVEEHECPVCYRVFSSGQALGGHKRSHLVMMSGSGHNNNDGGGEDGLDDGDDDGNCGLNGNNDKGLIDLNLPAPMEEDAELSVVSDAEFARGAR